MGFTQGPPGLLQFLLAPRFPRSSLCTQSLAHCTCRLLHGPGPRPPLPWHGKMEEPHTGEGVMSVWGNSQLGRVQGVMSVWGNSQLGRVQGAGRADPQQQPQPLSSQGLSNADRLIVMWMAFSGEESAAFFPHIEQRPALILHFGFPQMFLWAWLLQCCTGN